MILQANIRARHVKANNIGEYKSSLYPSETVPDEAMTIPYLLSRYVKGLPLPVQREGVNHDTDNFDSVDWEKAKNFDLVDHDNLRDEIAEIEEAHKEQIKKRKAAKSTSPNTPPQAGTAEPRAETQPEGRARDGAAAAAE